MTRVWLGLLAAFLIAIAAAKLAYSVTVDTGSEPAQAPWSQGKMEFVTWNEGKWTAWIRDGAFELDPQDTGNRHRHSNPSIAYIDWGGETWQAKIEGNEFVLAPHGNWAGSLERSDAIRYRDWSGNNQLRTVPDLQR
jgi:hypothetical protein